MDQLMQMACKAGKILLESGAETYRVEETMVKICEAYGANEAHSFVLPTGIFLSIIHEQNTQTQVVRVKNRALDLYKIDYINTLSRNAMAKQLTIEEFEVKLKEIAFTPTYPQSLILFCAGLCGGGFAFFYHGTYLDAIAGFFCTLMVKLVIIYFNRWGINSFINNAVGGAVATLLAILFYKMGVGSNVNLIVASTIMILVPGLAITNAIRDGIAGDLISGLTKAMEAFIIAISIALGTGAVLSVWLALFGGL